MGCGGSVTRDNASDRYAASPTIFVLQMPRAPSFDWPPGRDRTTYDGPWIFCVRGCLSAERVTNWTHRPGAIFPFELPAGEHSRISGAAAAWLLESSSHRRVVAAPSACAKRAGG